MPQETFLFSDTIRENIAFGATEASEREVRDGGRSRPLRRSSKSFRSIQNHGRGARRYAVGRTRSNALRLPGHLSGTAILILDDALASVDT